MALRDTTWVWDTGTNSPKTANAILTTKSGGIARVTVIATTYTQSRTQTEYLWIGVTKSAANSFMTKLDSVATNQTATMSEVNRYLGEYEVRMIVDSQGEWTAET